MQEEEFAKDAEQKYVSVIYGCVGHAIFLRLESLALV